MMGKMGVVWFLALAAVACLMTAPAAAFTHIVGGSFGWKTPQNLTFYQDWAKPRTFGVGDKLGGENAVFPYRTGVHSVVEVNEQEFEKCTQNDAINMHYSGPTTIELPKNGTFFYYCGVGTHCEAGQKLKVTVVNGEGSSGATTVTSDPHPSDRNSAAAFEVSGMLFLLLWAFL